MYVPNYLTLLENAGTVDGWPKWVDTDGKTFAVEQIKAGLQVFGQMDLDLARRCIFDDHAAYRLTGLTRPASLQGVALWDAIYAVTYRALAAAGSKAVYIGDTPDTGKKFLAQLSPRKWAVMQVNTDGTLRSISPACDKDTARKYLSGELKAA